MKTTAVHRSRPVRSRTGRTRHVGRLPCDLEYELGLVLVDERSRVDEPEPVVERARAAGSLAARREQSANLLRAQFLDQYGAVGGTVRLCMGTRVYVAERSG
jgi:hypothetical protein